MRRVARPLLNFITTLSLLLCLAIAALWVWSYRHGHAAEWDGIHGQRGVVLSHGSIALYLDDYVDRDSESWALMPNHFNTVYWPDAPNLMSDYVTSASRSWNLIGIGYGEDRAPSSASAALVLPLWFLLAISVSLPLRWRHAMRRWKRIRCQQCVRCGYDLRATPSQCPECGLIPIPPPPRFRWSRRRVAISAFLCTALLAAGYLARHHWSTREQRTIQQITAEPDTPESLRLKHLVQIVDDPSQPRFTRESAFFEFWRLSLAPGVDLVHLSVRYGIRDWLAERRLMDWTYSSQTPLDEDRLSLHSNSIYAVSAPDAIQDERNSVYICFSLKGEIHADELRVDLNHVYLDKARILHIAPIPELWPHVPL